MNTNSKHIAEQLRLAADIIETEHPWETCNGETWWKPESSASPAIHVLNGHKIRPVLATPPDGRQLINPRGLTAKEVGVGYRLLVAEDEFTPDADVFWDGTWRKTTNSRFYTHQENYRLPISVPWPEPAFQLPPPPPGMQWHRTDMWQEGDLPQGMRPLAFEEFEAEGDEDWNDQAEQWMKCHKPFIPVLKNHTRTRTSRPLTFEHAGKTWTWHRPGDLMPCEKERRIYWLYQDGVCGSTDIPEVVGWERKEGTGTDIIGWRYADEKKTVPLGPDDIPPCSVFRVSGTGSSGWHQMKLCPQWDGSVLFSSGTSASCEELMRNWHINRSIPLTGKWNPDAWEPCSKEVYA